MILRFEVNQAEAFRQGINVEKSTNHLNIDPSKLSQEERNLIADRLDGIDVFELTMSGHMEDENGKWLSTPEARQSGRRIEAMAPTYEALMEAIRKNEADLTEAIRKNKPLKATAKEAK